MRPLHITDPVKQVAVLNRWAAQVNEALNATNKLVAHNSRSIVATPPTSTTTVIPVTDGLVHGQLPWIGDPGYISYRDDFASGSTASPNIGDARWVTSFSSGTSYYKSGAFPNLGQFSLQSTAGADTNGGFMAFGNFASFPPGGDSWATVWPLLDYPSWQMTWVFCYERPQPIATTAGAFNLTKVSSYVGLANGWPSSFATRPPVFIGARFDTDTTAPAISDTTIHLEAVLNPTDSSISTRNNIQGTNGGVFDTGIVPVEGTFYRLVMTYNSANGIQLSLSGGGASVNVTFALTPNAFIYNTLTSGNAPILSNGFLNSNLGLPTISTTNGYLGLGPGSKVSFSGYDGTNTAINSVQSIVIQNKNASTWILPPAGFSVGSAQNTPVTLTGLPGVIPFAMLVNDSQGSAPSGERALCIDFFSFVWNPGVQTGNTQLPNGNNSRYF